MKEVIERCKWLINTCNDRLFTPDVKDDITYLLEENERLHSIIKEVREELNIWYENRNGELDDYQYKHRMEIILDKENKDEKKD